MNIRVEPGLADIYTTVRANSESLATTLSAEDAAIQSMPEASPVKWHLAHTNWFYEAVVLNRISTYKPFDSRFSYLFNSYYEALGPQFPRDKRHLISRPSLEEVLAWRGRVDAAISVAIDDDTFHAAIMLGLQHEQQHQELILTDIKHAFFCNPLLPPFRDKASRPHGQVPLEYLPFAGGLVMIGHDGTSFAFDNEMPPHEVMLQPFYVASRPIINSEYLAFIGDGGYRRAELWLSEGWTHVQEEGWTAPLYWLNNNGSGEEYSVFTLAGVAPLDPYAPVEHISFFEAAAYAAWAEARLLTEFEWEAASSLFEFGQVWEWTRSSYDPYPGFKCLQGSAAEYNAKFMVGQMVLRGGSVATPIGHARATYRNFFPPRARWQFTGIRLAKDVS